MADVTLKANKTKVMIDGAEMILLSDIDIDDSYALERVSGIGDIHVKENVPTVAQHVFTLNGYIPKPEPSWVQGIIPENGDVALQGRTFSVEVFEQNGLKRKYVEASCNRGRATLRAHMLFMKNAEFYALDAVGTF